MPTNSFEITVWSISFQFVRNMKVTHKNVCVFCFGTEVVPESDDKVKLFKN